MISREYLKGDLDGVLRSYIEAVQTGSKPAAACVIYRDLVPSAIEDLNSAGLHYVVFPAESERATIYLFRDLSLAKVIRYIEKCDPNSDKQLGAWITGKLFGYSDKEVVDYLGLIET